MQRWLRMVQTAQHKLNSAQEMVTYVITVDELAGPSQTLAVAGEKKARWLAILREAKLDLTVRDYANLPSVAVKVPQPQQQRFEEYAAKAASFVGGSFVKSTPLSYRT